MAATRKLNQAVTQHNEFVRGMRDWTMLASTVENLPHGVGLAVHTGRADLMAAEIMSVEKDGKPIAVERYAAVVRLAQVLLETNAKLQGHAAMLAEQVDNVWTSAAGLMPMLEDLKDMADYQPVPEDRDDY